MKVYTTISSILGEYHSVLGKTCRKNPLYHSRLLASTVVFNKLWAKLYSQYLCAFLVQVIHETNDKTVTCSEAIILSTSFENTTCQGIRHEKGTYHNGIAFQDKIEERLY